MPNISVPVKRLKELEEKEKELEEKEKELMALLLAQKEKRERLQAYQAGVSASYKQRPDN